MLPSGAFATGCTYLRIGAIFIFCTTKNAPFALWAHLSLQLFVSKSPQYTKYSELSETRFEAKSTAQSIKKAFIAVPGIYRAALHRATYLLIPCKSHRQGYEGAIQMELQQRYVERLQKCIERICGRQETGIADNRPRIW